MDEERKAMSYLYYILIGAISAIMLTIMPLFGSVVGLEWALPTTSAGWVVWSVSKLASALFNVLIFHCFVQQGKVNSLNNENFLKAQKIIYDTDKRLKKNPRSPKRFYADTYGKKGLTVFFTTILGLIGLSQAILTFNVGEFITMGTTLVMGIIFGFLSMRSTENFWTIEYLDYATMKQEEKE